MTKFNENCFNHPVNTVCISTKMSTPEKVGGTKHRASTTLQKVWGTCSPVHPWIYAYDRDYEVIESGQAGCFASAVQFNWSLILAASV